MPLTAGLALERALFAKLVDSAQSKALRHLVRTLYTMVNEAAKILEEGTAQRASDIDVVWVFGYGWPRTTGGPMRWADTIGLAVILDGLERYRCRLGTDVSVSTMIGDKVKNGTTFVGHSWGIRGVVPG